jgi:hypothetical protein
MFKNKESRIMFGPKKEEVTEKLRKFYNGSVTICTDKLILLKYSKARRI